MLKVSEANVTEPNLTQGTQLDEVATSIIGRFERVWLRSPEKEMRRRRAFIVKGISISIVFHGRQWGALHVDWNGFLIRTIRGAVCISFRRRNDKKANAWPPFPATLGKNNGIPPIKKSLFSFSPPTENPGVFIGSSSFHCPMGKLCFICNNFFKKIISRLPNKKDLIFHSVGNHRQESETETEKLGKTR